MSRISACTSCGASIFRSATLRRVVISALVSVLALQALDTVEAQQVRDNSILKPVYFFSFRDLYRGQYEQAYRGFRQAGRSAIRTIDTRWIDSICYHTMSGEVLYRQGDLQAAAQHYDSALRLYLQYSDWMLRMQFPDSIAPDISARQPPSWAKTKRRFRLARFPDTFSIMRGGQRIVATPDGRAGVANVQQLHALHVDELVRCTSLAILRHWELLGPSAKHDQLAQNVLNKLALRQGPPNHWSEIWLDLQLGVGYAAAGKKEQAAAMLKRSLLAGGDFDHPLTCLAMLELGRLALKEANYRAASDWLNESAISAYYFDQFEVMQEAFRLTHLVHMVTDRKGVHPTLAAAAPWANRKGLKEMYVSLLIQGAESYAVSGDLKRAESTISQARQAIGRREMAGGRLGARLNYVTAVMHYANDNEKAGGEALEAAIAFQRTGSVRLFQIAAADSAYVDGKVRERVATELYQQLLDDPAPIVWRHEPLEALSQLLIPQPVVFEHWFDAAMKRDDILLALDVVDRTRRARFFSTLPMGGRLLNLRWVMQGPAAALPQTALLQRNDLAGRFTRFVKLDREAQQLRSKLRAQPLLPENGDAARDQAKLLNRLARTSGLADKELLKIAVRREPVEMVFPALRNTKDVQEKLAAGEAILVFHVTPHEHHAFLLTKQRHGHWKIASPGNVKDRLIALLRTMGHYDQSREIDAGQLTDTSWRTAADVLMKEITSGAKVDLGRDVKDLVIVPDGLYWYVPFAALQVGKGKDAGTLLSRTRVRYAPMVGLTVADGRARLQTGDYAVVLGRLFAREDESFSTRAFQGLRDVVPRAHAIKSPLLAPSNALAVLLDGLIVLDDIEPADRDPLSVAPFQVDRGRPGASIEHWLSLPWGSPEVVVMPGFHTPAENSLKRISSLPRAGNELFLTSMGLFAAGSRTVVLSRWPAGGQTSANLIREFIQELPNTTAQDSWQRAVQIAQETIVDAALEPRVQLADDDPEVTAKHPFFWSGYLVIDWGPQGKRKKPAAAEERPKLKFPG